MTPPLSGCPSSVTSPFTAPLPASEKQPPAQVRTRTNPNATPALVRQVMTVLLRGSRYLPPPLRPAHGAGQKSPITSPPFIVPRARQVARAMVFETKRTSPSPKRTFTPPGCLLRAALCAYPEPEFVHGGFQGYVVPLQYGETSVPLLGVLSVMNWVQGRSSFSMSPRMS